MKLKLVLLFFCLLPLLSLAQKKVTLSGYIRDAESGESLIGATIYIKELKIAEQSNAYGFYSISVPAGKYTVLFAYVGYGSRLDTLALIESKVFNAELHNKSQLNEIQVSSARKDENIKKLFF